MVTKEDPVWGKASSKPSQEQMTAHNCHNSIQLHTRMTVGTLAPLGEAFSQQSPVYEVLFLNRSPIHSPYLRVRN